MSSYNLPVAYLPIFNLQEYLTVSNSLTYNTASKYFLKLTWGIETGLVTFNGGLSTNTINQWNSWRTSFSSQFIN